MALYENDKDLHDQLNKMTANIQFMKSFYNKYKSTWEGLDLQFSNPEYKNKLFKMGWVIFLLTKIILRRDEVKDCTCFMLAVLYVII